MFPLSASWVKLSASWDFRLISNNSWLHIVVCKFKIHVMNFFNRYILILLMLSGFLPQVLLAQEAPSRHLQVGTGIYHISILDQQASPLVYRGHASTIHVGFDREKKNALWRYDFNYGWLGFHASNPDYRFEKREFKGTYGALRISHLRTLSETGKSVISLGAMLQQEVVLDFEGVADFPWIFGQGGVFAKGSWEYQLSEQQTLSAKLAFPLFGWITDMPYNQIPRIEGRVPDEITVIKEGTRMVSWNSYQRIDLGLGYTFKLSERWQLYADYQWAWFHDKTPRDFWAYQGVLMVGVGYRW